MKLLVCNDYQEMSKKAAALIAAQVKLFPESILGLATGSTPIGTYDELIRLYNTGEIDFSEIETVNLDEYVGLGPDHEQSYRHFMNEQLFNHINLDPEMTHVPNGLAANPEEEAENYEMMVECLGGIDLQVLGLGPNGHIGFNEPDSFFTPGTHVVDLSKETIDANSRFFSSRAEVPHQAITLGVKQIMQAGKVILLVSGEKKAKALKAAVTGPVTPDLPASILQLHPDCTVFADEAACEWIYDD